MNNTYLFAFFLFLLLGEMGCDKVPPACEASRQNGLLKGKICGMSLTAPPDPFVQDPMAEMTVLGIDWVALLPFGFFDPDSASIQYDSTGNSGWWWGETAAGITTSHNLAQAQGMKTMLKPQLWSWKGWIGDMDYPSQAEWDIFHANYTDFICYWARLAESLDVDLFCIGTEIKASAMNHPAYWSNLIDTIRQIYTGKLTYAPNWDEYDQIAFWDQLDYIGVDAYFSLIPDHTPTVCDLKKAWEPTFEALEAFSKRWNKPILFTEWGYLSLDGCAYQTWKLEKNRSSASINEQAQANAAQALLETFGKEDWWAGGFQWKWYADLATSSQDRSDDYTPQGKMAADVLRDLYQ
ncbi:glycoside hydrolase family 113 [Aureispira anguillae]|uniref:GTA TIM-barrel-like domain-containing protein n=1 Tax=Aureispira anguillae TaxID=2864201 RepID=A0A915YDF1_9BACT|nr:hypothetical protein [Aureispira anguillae]BDS11038.1 hypothetical protein AsAng_0017490 [Aureispira anguillae]